MGLRHRTLAPQSVSDTDPPIGERRPSWAASASKASVAAQDGRRSPLA